MIPGIALATFASTMLGGLFALKFKDKLHLIIGFSAGAIIAVAFFDLIPEALELGGAFYDQQTMIAMIALGFVGYMLLDRSMLHHHHDGEHTECKRGLLGAGSLSVHSFLDGSAIGLAFQISASIGIVVAIAVLVHDFSDGINTVNMIVRAKGTAKDAFKWLFIDSIAPVVGLVSTYFFHIEENVLAILLAVFAGFFLFIGASDLLPESHHSHPTKWTTIMTVLGLVVMFLAIRIAGL